MSFSAASRFAALAPLTDPGFRVLWSVWLMANTCMWMNDVAAAWLMTTLTDSPVMVALVQTASTLPVFLFGLPSGALADSVDRQRMLLVTQFWIALTASSLALTVFAGAISAPLLLALTLVNGVALAMRWPVHSSLIPEIVPRPQLPAALALSGVAMNASRILGPTIAGVLIASLGTAWVFATNAALAVISGALLMRWRRPARTSTLPGERLLTAMRVGVTYVRHSWRMRTALLRTAVFFIHASALMALLPLVAKSMPDGSAGTYTALIAAMGLGAVLSVFLIPRWRRTIAHDAIIQRGSLVQAAMMLIVANAPNLWVALPALVINGVAWLTVANTISVSAQLALPNWVRARGMALYQTALMGSSAAGAALWGQVATFTDIRTGICAAAASGLVALWLTRRNRIGVPPSPDEVAPAGREPPAPAPEDPNAGPVIATVEYRIDPALADAFESVMQETRRSRLGLGARSWTLQRDPDTPGRYFERIEDTSWTGMLRRYSRQTGADEALRVRRHAFHLGDSPPSVTRTVGHREDTPG